MHDSSCGTCVLVRRIQKKITILLAFGCLMLLGEYCTKRDDALSRAHVFGHLDIKQQPQRQRQPQNEKKKN